MSYAQDVHARAHRTLPAGKLGVITHQKGSPMKQNSSTARTLTRRDFRCRRFLAELSDDTGAVTAEYAVIIIAAVAFAGVLVAIMRSDEVRSMLVDLVQRALGSAG